MGEIKFMLCYLAIGFAIHAVLYKLNIQEYKSGKDNEIIHNMTILLWPLAIICCCLVGCCISYEYIKEAIENSLK